MECIKATSLPQEIRGNGAPSLCERRRGRLLARLPTRQPGAGVLTAGPFLKDRGGYMASEIIDTNQIEPVRQHLYGLPGFDRLQNLGTRDGRDVNFFREGVHGRSG